MSQSFSNSSQKRFTAQFQDISLSSSWNPIFTNFHQAEERRLLSWTCAHFILSTFSFSTRSFSHWNFLNTVSVLRYLKKLFAIGKCGILDDFHSYQCLHEQFLSFHVSIFCSRTCSCSYGMDKMVRTNLYASRYLDNLQMFFCCSNARSKLSVMSFPVSKLSKIWLRSF